MKNKVTEWFPPHVQPVRIGWYQRDYLEKHHTEVADWWDGKAWFYGRSDGSKSAYPVSMLRRWRGLNSENGK